jgi:DNA-binding GntR family transcriptional regulator
MSAAVKGELGTAPVPAGTASLGQPQLGGTKSLVERAYRRIEEMIVRLELSPGLALSEASLSRLLDIGRTPVREALQILAREGLVAISPRRGIYVTEIRVDAQLRLMEVRRGLESLMASRAARLATPAERKEFAELHSAFLEAADTNDHVEFLRIDRQFNERIAAVADNEFAASAIGLIAGLSRRFWYRYSRQLANLPLTARLHADVAAAVSDGLAAEAACASDRLMDYIEQFAREVFDRAS